MGLPCLGSYFAKFGEIFGETLPSVGGISLLAFSTSTMEQNFLRNYFGDTQPILRNTLWWYSQIGVGSWIYQRKHLSTLRFSSRCLYSGIGSLIFNHGVILLLSILRKNLPNCKYLTLPLGATACFLMVQLGRSYGEFCDSFQTCSTSSSVEPAVAKALSPSKSPSPSLRCDFSDREIDENWKSLSLN